MEHDALLIALLSLLTLLSITATPAVAAQETDHAARPVVAEEMGQPDPAEVRLSIIYTGRSLGALGVLRDPDEHELIVEEAQRSGDPVRFATYQCWRSSSVTIFSPSADLDQEDLRAFLAAPASNNDGLQTLPILRSNNVTMLQLEDDLPDLLEVVRNNPRASIDYPDLVPATASVMWSLGADGQPILVVMEDGTEWPEDPGHWTAGEMNRIEVRDATLYELAVNLGQIGPRATLITKAVDAARARSSHPLVIDLGERDGDLGLERADRARVDYSVLTSLGYRLVVPYEFELALGTNGLADLHKQFPDIKFLAANVTEKTEEEEGKLFIERHVVEVEGIKIGFFGIVDPDLRGLLAKSALADFTFEDPVEAAARETATLRAEGVDAVVMLSNLHPRDNALVSREVIGVDAIVADLHVRWAPEEVRTEVTLPGRPRSRPGSPALVPRSFANGLGLGRLEMVFRSKPEGGFFLSSLSHDLESVTDRTPADAALVERVRAMVSGMERPRGEVLLPAFEEILEQRPNLRNFDSETAQGRISKRMWEEFLARLVRYRASAEVAIIPKLSHFPPAIGELHEANIRS